MTHKQKCIANCMQYLEQLMLGYAYSEQIFNHYYRKFNGYNSNAYIVGLDAADMMIKNCEPKIYNYDTGND